MSKKKFVVLISRDRDANEFVKHLRTKYSEVLTFIPRNEHFHKGTYDRILKSIEEIINREESVVIINDLFPYLEILDSKTSSQEFEYLIRLTNLLSRHNTPVIHLSNQNFDTLDMNDYFEFPEYIRLALSMEMFASHYERSVIFRNPQFLESKDQDMFSISTEKLSYIVYCTSLFLCSENNPSISDKYTSFFKDDFFHDFVTKYKLVSTGIPREGAFDSEIAKSGFAHRWVFVENATIILHMLEDLNFFLNKNQNYLQEYLPL